MVENLKENGTFGLNDGTGKVTLRRSIQVYIKEATAAGLIIAWGILSIVYWIFISVNSNINPIFKSTVIEIFLGVSVLVNLMSPFAFLVFLPIRLTINQDGVSYTARGRIKHMSWNEIIKVDFMPLPVGVSDKGNRVVIINGAQSTIMVPPILGISADSLVTILVNYRNKYAKEGMRPLKINMDEMAFQSSIRSSGASDQIQTERKLYEVRRVYTFIIIAIALFFTIGMGVIWWSLRLLHPQ